MNWKESVNRAMLFFVFVQSSFALIHQSGSSEAGQTIQTQTKERPPHEVEKLEHPVRISRRLGQKKGQGPPLLNAVVVDLKPKSTPCRCKIRWFRKSRHIGTAYNTHAYMWTVGTILLCEW